MNLDFFYKIFNTHSRDSAIIHKNETVFYANLLQKISHWKYKITENNINPGEVVALNGDFTPNTISILFALMETNNIIVPFNYNQLEKNTYKYKIAGVQKIITIDNDENVIFNVRKNKESNCYYERLQTAHKPGLVLFTSGTSGEPKAAVHDFSKLLEKFKLPKKSFKTLNFLLFDHWGGLNTLFHTLSNGGIVLALKDRNPQSVCAHIEKHKIELLPVSPSFLNLLLMSEEYKNYNLSSLRLITYGTEPMPQTTLVRLKKTFPHLKLQQTYGLIELGVLRSKSKNDGSLWVKIGGAGFQTRVVNNLLEIKAESAMLGYINAPSPFTKDGWFMTGDHVKVDGEYIKILGRKSEIINVGGEKVYPIEIENVIQEIDNVEEVTIFGEKNAIMGNIVCAKIKLIKNENKKEFSIRLKKHCMKKMQAFKVPIKIIISEQNHYNDRFKKKRC